MTDLTTTNPVQLLRFEIGFGATPATTSITWTDITSQVLLRAGITMSTGKTYTDRVARPGTLSFTVDNSRLGGTEGRWSLDGPNMTSGWALRVPVRVSFVTSTNTRYLWSGFVDTVSTRYESGYRPIVTINASDVLARWQRLQLPNAITREQLVDQPVAYWPLDDSGVVATNRGSGNYGNLTIDSFNFFPDGNGDLLLGQDSPVPFGLDTFSCAYANTSVLGNGKYLTSSEMPDWVAGAHTAETWSFYYYKPDDSANVGNVSRGLFSVYGRPGQAAGSVYFTLSTDIDGELYALAYADFSVDAGAGSFSMQTSSSPTATATTTATGSSGATTITTNTATTGTIGVGHVVTGTGIGSNALVTAVSGTAPTQTVTLSVPNAGTVSGTITFTPPTRLTTIGWYHIAITHSGGPSVGSTGTWTVYVNGTSVLTRTYTMASFTTLTKAMSVGARMLIGGSVDNQVSVSGTSTTKPVSSTHGYFANFAYYTSVLSSARLLEHAKLISGYAPELSTSRFTRLCTYAGLSTNSYGVYSSQPVTMGAQPLLDGTGQGRSLLDLINEIATSEDGDVFALGTGKVYFQPRVYRYNQTSQFSLPATAINADNGYDHDQTFITNDVTVTDGAGHTSHAEDATSIAAYGRQNQTDNVYVSDLVQLDAAARGRASRDSTPRPRLRDVTVDFVTAPASVRTVLEDIFNTRPTQTFTITGMPTATSTSSSLVLFAEGWSDSITESSWSRSYVASPVTSFYTGVWQVGSSTLNTSTKLAY